MCESVERGFSIVEAVLTVAVAAVALFVMITVFSSGSRQAVQTRNRAAAILVAESLMEEVQAHSFGAARPSWWPPESEPSFTETGLPTVQAFRVFVDDRPQEMLFYRRLELQNGSLVGAGQEKWDRAFITVYWRELQPGASSPEVKKVTAEVAAWRSHAP